MDKLKMQTTNVVDENIKRIGELFPNCLTERLDENGRPEVAIDFDQLRQELSKDIVEGPEERYQFTWPDKRNAIRLANAPTTDTLRPCREESVDFDNTQNLYIEGDNLEVLKLLRENYLGKVKMIYIDPPYNTGNDFVYNDDFAQTAGDYVHNSGQEDEQGNRLVANTESNGRFHTDWLNMIYPRLKVAKDLLSEDGVIFISIDDNEVENLKKVCDEVFGERNSQALITYVRKTSGKQDSSNFMKSTEYIVVYSKTDKWECQPLIADTHVTDRYNKTNNEGRAFRETDLRKTGNADRREDRPLMFYPFYFNPSNNELIPSNIERPDLKSKGYIEIFPIKPDGTDGRWRWGIDNAKNNVDFLVAREMPKYKGKFTVYEIDYIDKKGEIRTVKEHTSWDRKDFNSDNAMAEFKKLGFSNQLFPFPKSSALIKHIAFLADTPNSVVLDFFSGSATTAHAVMQLNAEDGGNRKFIMVQLPEATDEKSEAYKAGYKNICEIGKERIRRAGKKILEEQKIKMDDIRETLDFSDDSNLGSKVSGLKPVDVGFRVLKLDSSNMQDVYYSPEEFNEKLLFEDNIKPDRTDEDLLFQAMIELGIELSAKIEKQEIAGKTVWNVAEGYLMACFDKDVNETAIKAIAKQHPYYFVLRDASLATDQVADNFEQIWEEYSKDTIRRII